VIPKIIHQIWIGDQSKRPSQLMQTWVDLHPSWSYRLWTEKEILEFELLNRNQFDLHPTLPGKADIARYEILFRLGGFFIDADSICIKPLDNLLRKEFVCCYESERHRGNLVANGYIGCPRRHKSMSDLIRVISNLSHQQITDVGAWKTVGPVPFSHVVRNNNLEVMPSSSFLPVHYEDFDFKRIKMSQLSTPELKELAGTYTESFSYQFWGSKSEY